MNEIKPWSRTYAVSIIPGLLTDPRLHANDIRLEWLLRLVIAQAPGKRKPTREQLSKVLNTLPVEARVERLEDPLDDVFCDHANTAEGSYRIILGRWEASRMTRIACVISTRKSLEEGLDEAFNSLDAQREACAAFVTTRKHADWLAVRDLYDDGGLSGGTMERAVLQRITPQLTRARFAAQFIP